jgi:hypothetical protein
VRAVFERAADELGEDRTDRPLSDDLANAVQLVQEGL